MTTNWHITGPAFGCDPQGEAILRALPDWFGIESSIVQYVKDIKSMPTWLALNESNDALGFLTLKEHNEHAAEIQVMGILKDAHRQGIGRALVQHAEDWLRAKGTTYLQVKTLGPSYPDPNYARTHKFYHAVGFRPLEEFNTIWGEKCPCLVMVKKI